VTAIPHAVPRLAETTVDGRVLLFAATTAVATAVLFGFAPALSLWRTSVHGVLKNGARTSSASPGSLRVRKTLVAGELALSAVLLAGAGLMVKSFVRLTAWPPGFAPDRVLTMRMQFSGQRYRDVRNRRTYIDEMLHRAREAPGVEAAGVSSGGDGRMLAAAEEMADGPPDQRPAATGSTP